tara:strand:- start:4 stop:477 length:474 start_codon:yes stop_codon:yes gene_type:complete
MFELDLERRIASLQRGIKEQKEQINFLKAEIERIQQINLFKAKIALTEQARLLKKAEIAKLKNKEVLSEESKEKFITPKNINLSEIDFKFPEHGREYLIYINDWEKNYPDQKDKSKPRLTMAYWDQECGWMLHHNEYGYLKDPEPQNVLAIYGPLPI